jgi:hypothetical protein
MTSLGRERHPKTMPSHDQMTSVWVFNQIGPYKRIKRVVSMVPLVEVAFTDATINEMEQLATRLLPKH